jgi:hypothetical protein
VRSGGYVKNNALKGRRFDSLDDHNVFLRHSNRTIARRMYTLEDCDDFAGVRASRFSARDDRARDRTQGCASSVLSRFLFSRFLN